VNKTCIQPDFPRLTLFVRAIFRLFGILISIRFRVWHAIMWTTAPSRTGSAVIVRQFLPALSFISRSGRPFRFASKINPRGIKGIGRHGIRIPFRMPLFAATPGRGPPSEPPASSRVGKPAMASGVQRNSFRFHGTMYTQSASCGCISSRNTNLMAPTRMSCHEYPGYRTV